MDWRLVLQMQLKGWLAPDPCRITNAEPRTNAEYCKARDDLVPQRHGPSCHAFQALHHADSQRRRLLQEALAG
eukprot:5144326-Lingulodinium_polyedra.AAC.1